jgi:hypothetical protein
MSTAVSSTDVAAPRRPTSYAVVRALAAAELRRTVRTPVIPLGLAASLWFMWTTTPQTEKWSGAAYSELVMTSAPLLLATSWVSAVSFHRERTAVGLEAPVGDGLRAWGRLLASGPLLALAAVFAVLLGIRERELGGLTLGTEPGRTTEALHSVPELAQHVALAVLAVALGAALGRRVTSLVLALPVLLVFWFAVDGFSWLFGHRAVTPFSVVQVQPVSVPAGPAAADPLDFPAHWLLEPPGEFQEGWARLFVSTDLAWWHDGWVLGVALVLLAAAFPGGTTRRVLLATGVLAGAVCAAAQVWVIP